MINVWVHLFYVGYVIRGFCIYIFNRDVTFVCAALLLFLCLPIGCFFWNESDVTRILRRLKSPTTRLFVHHIVKTNNNNKNKNSYALRLWPYPVLGNPHKCFKLRLWIRIMSCLFCFKSLWDIVLYIYIYILHIIICWLRVHWMSSNNLEVLSKIQSISFGKVPLKMISGILLVGAYRWTCVHITR